MFYQYRFNGLCRFDQLKRRLHWELLRRIFCVIQLLVACLLLSACLGDSDDPVPLLFAPVVGMDFPATGPLFSTDSASFTATGVVVATTVEGISSSVEFSLDDDDSETAREVVGSFANGSSPFESIFYWKQELSLLKIGNNRFFASAKPSDPNVDFDVTNDPRGTTGFGVAEIIRGTSYLWESTIQIDVSGNGGMGQWYVLDTARKALLQVALPPTDNPSSIKVVKAGFSESGDGNGDDFDTPVDFVIDQLGVRALVLDRKLATIIEVDLSDRSRTILPITGDVLVDPVAIEIDPDTNRVFVVDKKRASIIAVDLGTNVATVFSSATVPNADDPFETPVDVVYQPTTMANSARLFVSDRRRFASTKTVDTSYMDAIGNVINTTTDVDVDDVIVVVDASTGERSLLLDPNEIDLQLDASSNLVMNDDTLPEADFSEIGRLALGDELLDGVFLYVTDSGFASTLSNTGVVSICIAAECNVSIESVDDGMGGTTMKKEKVSEGERNRFSGRFSASIGGGAIATEYVPSSGGNSFKDPESIVFANNRLLVLDNFLGSIVELMRGLDPETRGGRSFLAGGATNTAPGGALEATSTGLASPPNAVRTGGLSGLTQTGHAIDKDGNTLFFINLISSRVSVLEQVTSLPESIGATGDEADRQQAVEDTTFRDPRGLQFSAAGTLIVVDATTDRVIEIPNSTGREVVSNPSASAIEFINPVATAIVEKLDDNNMLEESILYVFDADRSDVISVDLDGEVATNRIALPLLPDCTFADVSAMTAFETEDKMQYLVIAERSNGNVHLIDLAANSCDTFPFSPTAGAEIVDVEVGNRDVINDAVKLFALDRSNRQISTFTIDSITSSPFVPVMPVDGGFDVVSGPGIPDNANNFISADSMVFASAVDRIYVLDNVIQSIYMVDVKPRDGVDGKRNEEGEISGQRLVFYRGTSMNCDPAATDPSVVEPGGCDL